MISELSSLELFTGIIVGIVFIIAAPLGGAFILQLFSRIFKFSKQDYRPAIITLVISLSVTIPITQFIYLFSPALLQSNSPFIGILHLAASFIAGYVSMLKIYGESPGRTVSAWILTCLSCVFIIVILILLFVLIIKLSS